MRSRSHSRNRSRSRSSRRRRRNRSRSRSRSRTRSRSRSRSRTRRSRRSRSSSRRSPPPSRRNLIFQTPQHQQQFTNSATNGDASTAIPSAAAVTPAQISQVLRSMITAATSPGSPGAALIPSRPSNTNHQMLKGKLPEDLRFRYLHFNMYGTI